MFPWHVEKDRVVSLLLLIDHSLNGQLTIKIKGCILMGTCGDRLTSPPQTGIREVISKEL